MTKLRRVPPVIPLVSKICTVFILGCIVACGSVSNPDRAVNRLKADNGITQQQADRIASILALYPNKTQLSIALVDSSRVAYYGAIRMDDTLETVENADKVFETGSFSKVFTSAMLADLAARNRIAIDDPIRKYLGISMHDGSSITFRQLSNHTSGLPRVPGGFVWESLWHLDNPYKDYNEATLRNYLQNEMELLTEPGEEYQYSNIGAGLLGYTLTQVENREYEQLLQYLVAGPLSMNRTTTVRDSVKKQLVSGLTKRGEEATNWDLGALQGAGAVLSTVTDLSRFISANFDPGNEPLNMQRQETYRIDEERGIALGWFILYRDSGEAWHWHNGGTGGYRSSVVLDVEDRLGVAVLSNISAGHSRAANIDSLSFMLLESLEAAIRQ